jgi:hypothetical protein
MLDHLVFVGAVGGNANLSTACAVNNPAFASVYSGTIAGISMQSGTFIATVQSNTPTTLASQSAVERSQSLERPQTVSVTSAKILLSTGATVALTGTVDSNANTVNLVGGGYLLTGTVSNGVVSGTYTGPNSSSGGFATLSTTQGAITAYCGTFSSTLQPAGQAQTTSTGVFNLQIAANGAASGVSTPTATGSASSVFTGQANGSTVTLVHISSDGITANNTNVTATVQNGTISGSLTTNGGTGTFSGTACALPS